MTGCRLELPREAAGVTDRLSSEPSGHGVVLGDFDTPPGEDGATSEVAPLPRPDGAEGIDRGQLRMVPVGETFGRLLGPGEHLGGAAPIRIPEQRRR
jgi:hypothetical protein